MTLLFRYFLNRHHVAHLVHHPAYDGRVGMFNRLLQPTQTQGLNDPALVPGQPDTTSGPFDLQFRHLLIFSSGGLRLAGLRLFNC